MLSDGPRPLQPIIEVSPEETQSAKAMAWFSFALHLESVGKPEEAIDAYRQAIELFPEQEAFYLQATQRLIQDGRKEDAFNMLDAVLKRNPDNTQALRWKARLYRDDQQADLSLQTYEKALATRPDQDIIYVEALQAALRFDRPDLALEFAWEGSRRPVSTVELTSVYLRFLEVAAENADDLQTLSDLNDEADQALEQAVTRFPQHLPFLYSKAEQAWSEQKPETAFSLYHRIDAASEDQDQERARMLVHGIQSLGGGRAGTRTFRSLAEAQTQDPLAAYLQGTLWELQRAPDRALKAYELALKLSPSDVPSLLKKAILLYQQGEPVEAMTLLDQLLELHPGHPEYLVFAGQIALISKQYSKAVAYLGERIELLKQGVELEEAPALHAQYAVALWNTGADLDRIRDQLEQAAQEPGHIEFAWRQRYQTIFERREKHPESAEELETQLFHLMEDLSDLLPRNPEPAWLAAQTSSMRKEYSLTLEYLEEVEFRARFTSDPEVWMGPEFDFDRAAALERSGKLDQAEELFLEIIEQNPDFHSALNYLAYMWAEQGENLDQALDFVQRALRLDPENPSYIDTLGWIYYQQGQFEPAYEELLRSAELLPQESVIAEHLGDVLMKLNRPVEARGYYRIALALNPAERTSIVKTSLAASERRIAEEMFSDSVPEL